MSEVIVIKANKNNGKIRKSAAYCRVSTEKNEQTPSYTKQIQLYTEMFRNSETEVLVEIYTDRESGTSADKREDFLRMISDCRKGKIDRIYTKSVSRFARNTKESLTILRELKSLGISVYFEKEQIDTASMTSETMLTLHSVFAQSESESMSKNIRWSVEKRMQNGTFNSGAPPYGFRYDDCKNLVIYDDEAEIIREIFRLYLDGSGIFKIEKTLRQNCKKKFGYSQISRILHNEQYCGDIILRKHYKSDTLPYKNIRNNGRKQQFFIENHHPAIVSKADWQAVQTMIAERDNAVDHTHKPNIFTGRLFCGNCGRALTKTADKRNPLNEITFFCPTRLKDLTKCGTMRFKETELKSAFVRMCGKLKITPEIFSDTIRQLEYLERTANSGDEAVSELQLEIAKLKEQHHVYAKLKSQSMIDEALFLEQTNSINTKLMELQKQLNRQKKSNNGDNATAEIRQLRRVLENSDTTEFDETLFKTIAVKIRIYSEYKAEFELPGGLKFTEKLR